MNIYEWNEIANIAGTPGVYAWYYRPEITSFDLKKTIKKVSELKNTAQTWEANKLVEAFLEEYVFSYFKQEPYSAHLSGPLKPFYTGHLEHQTQISQSLVDRIVEDPERLVTIKEILEISTPQFASPIYIGMAEKLKDRLLQHKRLIEHYRQNESAKEANNVEYQTTAEQNFAIRICKRGIVPTRLFVTVQYIESTGNRYIDIENVLNRINFPLLGRN